MQLHWLAAASHYDHIEGDPKLYADACRALFNYEIVFHFRRAFQSPSQHALGPLDGTAPPRCLRRGTYAPSGPCNGDWTKRLLSGRSFETGRGREPKRKLRLCA